MSNFPTVKISNTKQELIQQMRDVHNSLIEFYKSIPLEYFDSEGVPDGWSARRNLKHISGSNKAFAIWIGLPKFLLKIFGKATTTPIPLDKISATNRPGIEDYGKYCKNEKGKESDRDKQIKEMIESTEKVCKAIDRWTEEELDTLKGPMRKASLRTFCYFVIKHSIHHSSVAKARLGNI